MFNLINNNQQVPCLGINNNDYINNDYINNNIECNYKTEENIDFFSELYKSLDIEDSNNINEEDDNLCLITKKQLTDSLDRILIAHRNTKLFLFLMSGPFFLFFCFVKYSLKLSIMYILYKKGTNALK